MNIDMYLTIPFTRGRAIDIERPHRNVSPSWFHVWRTNDGTTIFIGRLKITTDYFKTPALI